MKGKVMLILCSDWGWMMLNVWMWPCFPQVFDFYCLCCQAMDINSTPILLPLMPCSIDLFFLFWGGFLP